MGSTYSVTATIEQDTMTQSHTTGTRTQHYEKMQNAKPLYDPSSTHSSNKLNINARLKRFATVALNHLGLKQARTDHKSVKKAAVPLSQSFPQMDLSPEDPQKSRPALSEMEQLYLEMNIVTTVNKANIGHFLMAFGKFVLKLCAGMCIKPTGTEVAKWVISMDKSLLDSRWTKESFLLESHIVFLFMLMELYAEQLLFLTVLEVREAIHVCLYISYAYNADEISYPARPFLSLGQDRNEFFTECVGLGLMCSSEMLEINQDQDVYRRHLARLLTYA